MAATYLTDQHRLDDYRRYPRNDNCDCNYYISPLILLSPLNIPLLTHLFINRSKETDMEDVFKLISEVGFPIAAAMAGGYFVFLTMRFILDGVMDSVNRMKGIIGALDNRVQTMNHDIIRIDTLMSNAFDITPDVNRIARADGKNDARKD